MDTFASELLDLLGRSSNSTEVQAFIKRFNLTNVNEDPPFRRYVGSNASGIDVLFENNHVRAIQIYASAGQGFSAFGGHLPFGIQPNMGQMRVHALLGAPTKADQFDSKFDFPSSHAKLTVNYSSSGAISYINIGPLLVKPRVL